MDRKWLARFGVTGDTTAEDWTDDELSARDLVAVPPPERRRVRRPRTESRVPRPLLPWDPERSLEIARRHGFEARAEGPRVGHYDYVNIDDDMIGVHHHAKWHKFGITRSWDTVSMEIRAGRMTREDAIELLRKHGAETPWPDIKAFCDYVGVSESQYFATLERFRNREIWSRRDGRWEIEGFLIPDFTWPERSGGGGMTEDVDAVVIGSNIRGLVAAYVLSQLGYCAIVLERSERLGGADGSFVRPRERSSTTASTSSITCVRR